VSAGHPGLTSTHRVGTGRVLSRGSATPYRSLAVLDGEDHVVRTELTGPDDDAAPGRRRRPLLCFAHLTDLQLADVQSPARFEFFNREFADPRFAELIPVQRPQEALTAHAVDAMVRVINGMREGPAAGAAPEVVVTSGDAIDNAQWNELIAVFALLEGGRVRLNSGGPAYQGVQAPWWPDDIFWQPDRRPGATDVFRAAFGFPELPGLLEAAIAPFDANGLRLPWLACHGNHEALVQGLGRVTPGVAAALVGDRKPTRIAEGVPADRVIEVFTNAVDTFMPGEPVEVTADPDRRPVSRKEFVGAHFRGGARPSGHGFSDANGRDGTAYYAYDAGPVRFVVLDTACVDGGADGRLDAEQASWLTRELIGAHSEHLAPDGSPVRTSNQDRLVVLVSHHGPNMLTNRRGGSDVDRGLGGGEVVRLVHRFPNVILWINGHIHANAARPHRDPVDGRRGFWEVTTSSIVDWPCQARLLELIDEGDGTLSIVSTMLDHDGLVDEGGVRPFRRVVRTGPGWAAP
jgi:metallophosphoesterase (TIGR03767 family)